MKFVFKCNIYCLVWWDYTKLIKRRSNVQEKNMSCERTLNFDQWKTFSENYKSTRVWLWLIYKFTENYYYWRLFSEFIQTQKKYPTFLDKLNLKTTCHVKLKCFLWAKLLKNLFLAKYLISVTAPLISWIAENRIFRGNLFLRSRRKQNFE